MNKRRLEKEGKKWVKDGIITDEQLQVILKRYVKEDKSYFLIILAALLISISMIIFIFSDWAQIPNVFKIIVMLIIMVVLYSMGFYSFNVKELNTNKTNRQEALGNSFIILGYMMFGTTLLLTLYMYNVNFTSAWPMLVWSVVGLALYIIVPNHYLLTIALLITIYGQLQSGLSFSTFNYIIFILFFIGYFHYVFHRGNIVTHYIFAIGLVIQLLILSITEFEQFYWFMLFILAMYLVSLILPKELIRNRFRYIVILSILIYKIYEVMIIQEDYLLSSVTFEPIFFISHSLLFMIVAILLWLTNKKELITLLLFAPLFYLPYAYLFIIVSMFIYSLYWLIYGFQTRENNYIMLGIFSFLISTFTVIVQYAWETLNKALFFLIAGLILFVISIVFERNRRKEDRGGKRR